MGDSLRLEIRNTSKGARWVAAVIATAGAILAYQLVLPPVVGLADEGDFLRTIGRFGYGPQHKGRLEYAFVEPKYVPDPHYRNPYWEQANSEYLFVGAALVLNKLVSKDGALDITVVGVVHALAFLAAFGNLLWVTRESRGRLLLWAGALVALTDSGYVVFWNSLYTEPASCIFLLLLLGESAVIAKAADVTEASLLRWSAWSFLLVFSKFQNAPLGLILGLFALRMAAWTRTRRARTVAALGAGAILGCTVYDVAAMPARWSMAVAYNMVFSGILPESRDPHADLRALGLDPRFAAYAGTGAWSPATRFPDLVASGVLGGGDVTTFTVVRFYLRRPARLWRRLHTLLPAIGPLRLDGYGNFEPSAGLPNTLSRAFGLWSAFHAHVLTPCGKWILFALAAWPIISVWRWAHKRHQADRRRLELVVLLPVGCLAALLTAVFGDAFDLVRHLYLFHLLLDACVIFAAARAGVALQVLCERTTFAPARQRSP